MFDNLLNYNNKDNTVNISSYFYSIFVEILLYVLLTSSNYFNPLDLCLLLHEVVSDFCSNGFCISVHFGIEPFSEFYSFVFFFNSLQFSIWILTKLNSESFQIYIGNLFRFFFNVFRISVHNRVSIYFVASFGGYSNCR